MYPYTFVIDLRIYIYIMGGRFIQHNPTFSSLTLMMSCADSSLELSSIYEQAKDKEMLLAGK